MDNKERKDDLGQLLQEWLKENDATIQIFALSPSGQITLIKDILIPGLEQAGWRIAWQVAMRDNAPNT